MICRSGQLSEGEIKTSQSYEATDLSTDSSRIFEHIEMLVEVQLTVETPISECAIQLPSEDTSNTTEQLKKTPDFCAANQLKCSECAQTGMMEHAQSQPSPKSVVDKLNEMNKQNSHQEKKMIKKKSMKSPKEKVLMKSNNVMVRQFHFPLDINFFII